MIQSIFPILTIVVFLFNKFSLPFDILEKVLNISLPEESAEFIKDFIDFNVTNEAISVIVIIFAFNLSVGGIIYLIRFLNKVNNVASCNILIIYIRGFMFALFVAFMFILMIMLLVLMSFNSYILFPIYWLFMFTIFLIAFKFLPCKVSKVKKVYKGALFISFAIALILCLTPIYAPFLISYRTIYGSFSSIMITILLFQVFSYIIYFGIIINAFNDEKVKK